MAMMGSRLRFFMRYECCEKATVSMQSRFQIVNRRWYNRHYTQEAAMGSTELNRREVLKSLAAMTAALLATSAAGQNQPGTQPAARDKFGDLLPQRKLGKTGAMVTMLGLGGSHVGRPSEAEAQKMIETAIAGGVRFFDTAAVYQNGGSENRYGKFLTPKYRDVIFLMTKTRSGDAAGVRQDLDNSLRRLNTDHIDLWQIHELLSVNDANSRLDKGVLDVLIDAKAKGKVKHIGFTGHVTPDSHLRMLERTRDLGDPLETCQMPINVADPSYSSFTLKVIPKLLERGFGVIAMKTLAGGGFFGRRNAPRVVPDRVSVAEALQYVWSLPVSVLVSGPDSAAQYQETINIARSFGEFSDQRRQELIAKVAGIAGRQVEYYKA
jgi:aryl-alcohol dehydrogenase-like predicted oxidoreductase